MRSLAFKFRIAGYELFPLPPCRKSGPGVDEDVDFGSIGRAAARLLRNIDPETRPCRSGAQKPDLVIERGPVGGIWSPPSHSRHAG